MSSETDRDGDRRRTSVSSTAPPSADRPVASAGPGGTERPSRREDARAARRRSHRWRSGGERVGITAAALALVAGTLWLTYQFVEPAPPDSLRIASGAPEGAYHAFALELAEVFAEQGIALEVVATEGSIENLALLDAGEVEIGFVQSGLAAATEHSALEGLASLYFEPLWVFTTRTPRPERMRDLKGLRVAIGAEGSGSRRVALELLAANGIEPDDLALEPLGGRRAKEALLAGQLDAMMTVASIDAAVVRALLEAEDVVLMDFARAPAYARRYPWLTALTLPAGVIDLARDVPARDVSLVAVAATLVARDTLHPALADLAMQAAARVFASDTLFSTVGRFPSREFVDFPLSDEAERYYRYGVPFLQRFLPFWAATLIDRLKLLALPLLALLLPLSRLLPPAYRWTVRRKVYRWYEEVQRIDQRAGDDGSRATLAGCLARLEQIEDESRDIDVPLSYAHELYALRLHIDLLGQQIRRRLARDGTPPAG